MMKSMANDHFAPIPPDHTIGYPANAFAFRYVTRTAEDSGARSLVEVGVGLGNALDTFSSAGLDVYGFDNKPEMVATSREKAAALGIPADRFSVGALEDASTFSEVSAQGPFDLLVAMGVLPHIPEAQPRAAALRNIRSLLTPGGYAFIEFRNLLFSLVTFNRYSFEFIMDDLLAGVPDDVRAIVADDLRPRLEMNRPPVSGAGITTSGFDNPLTIPALFRQAGFTDVETIYFHFHPGMPYLEERDAAGFRAASHALEDQSVRDHAMGDDGSDWRGMFLASAFLIKARAPLDASSNTP